MREKTRYRPEIDGLRALAVLGVILFHSGLALPGGFVGVDVFFVISGYLICANLIRERESTNTVSIANFWVRRVRRLVPALFFCVLCTWIIGWFLLLPEDFRRLGQSVVAQSVVLSNVYFWMKTGYFQGAAETKPLLHTWSLAIEEQFYILLPLLFLFWRGKQSRMQFFFLALFGLSLACSIFLTGPYPRASFYLLHTRAWELLMGCLLALAGAKWKGSTMSASLVSAFGLLLIGGPMFFYSAQTSFPGCAVIPPCLGTALLIWSNSEQRNGVGKLISFEPFRQIGLASYSLYLWHWPIFAFASYYDLLHGLGNKVGLTLLGLLLGWASYQMIELKTRHLKFLGKKRFAATLALVSAIALISLGLMTSRLRGFPQRLPDEVERIAGVSKDLGAFVKELSVEQIEASEFVPFGIDKPDPDCFVWGDSHAMAALPCIDQVAKEFGVSGLAATHSATPPSLGFVHGSNFGLGHESPEYNQIVQHFLLESGIKEVLLVSQWGLYVESPGFEEGLQATIISLQSAEIEVSLLRQAPEQSLSLPKRLALARWWGLSDKGFYTTEQGYREQRTRTDELFGSVSTKVLDPLPIFFDGGSNPVTFYQGLPAFRDKHHLSGKGSMLLKPLVEEWLKDVSLRARCRSEDETIKQRSRKAEVEIDKDKY